MTNHHPLIDTGPRTSTAPRSASPAEARPILTPYHSLGGDRGAFVPAWVRHRAVYRSAGRTLYVVDTDRLDAARGDLDRLARDGWDVSVERGPSPSSARIAMVRSEFAKAA